MNKVDEKEEPYDELLPYVGHLEAARGYPFSALYSSLILSTPGSRSIPQLLTMGSGSPAMSPHHDAFAMEPTDEVGYEGRSVDNGD